LNNINQELLTQKETYKETELGLLPESWEAVRLKDVAKKNKFSIVDGPFGSQMKVSEFVHNGIPLIEMQNLKDNKFDINFRRYINEEKFEQVKRSQVMEDDLIISKTGTLGLIAIVPTGVKRAIITSRLAKIDFDFSKIHLMYSYFTLLNLKRIGYWEEIGEGSTMKVLTINKISNAKIPLPPLLEQRKIAYILSAIQEAKEKTENVINTLKELKKSLMKHLFNYGAVSLREAKKVKLKETEIGLVPESWEVKQLNEISTLQRGKDLPKTKWVMGEYPIVGSSGILGYHNQYICEGPGIITGRSGSIGSITYVAENYWPHNTGLYVKDFHKNNPKFIYYLLQRLDFKRYATGVSVPTLNRNFIHLAKLPLPPPSNQQQISLILSTLDKKIESEKNNKKALEELFKSMLHNLMTAKIRVNHIEIEDAQAWN
jgi:type I restriction enzyme S subunit